MLMGWLYFPDSSCGKSTVFVFPAESWLFWDMAGSIARGVASVNRIIEVDGECA